MFGCPHCQSADVRERNVAYASLRITDWNEDGTPAAFDSDEDAEWESVTDCPNPLVCYDCGREFGWDDVVRLPSCTGCGEQITGEYMRTGNGPRHIACTGLPQHGA